MANLQGTHHKLRFLNARISQINEEIYENIKKLEKFKEIHEQNQKNNFS